MRSADGHIDHADLVFHLAHHDAGLASVRGHPVQNAGRRAHGISAIEFHPGSGAAHSHGGVSAEHSVLRLSHGKRVGEGLEVGCAVFVAGARHIHVFFHHGLALLLELFDEHALQRLEADAHHVEGSAQGERVLRDFVARDIRQFRNGKRAKLHARSSGARLDRVGIVNARRARGEQVEVAIHGVLVQRDQQVNAVSHIGNFVRTGADGQKSVAAANNGLIGVVGVQMQSAAAEDLGEDVTGCGNTLAGGAANTDGEGFPHDSSPSEGFFVRVSQSRKAGLLSCVPPSIHPKPSYKLQGCMLSMRKAGISCRKNSSVFRRKTLSSAVAGVMNAVYQPEGRIDRILVWAVGPHAASPTLLKLNFCNARSYCTVKLHTFNVPPGVAFTLAPQWSRLVTVFCSVRKAKFRPTVCSVPPAGVTKMEYVCAVTLIASRKWNVLPPE